MSVGRHSFAQLADSALCSQGAARRRGASMHTTLPRTEAVVDEREARSVGGVLFFAVSRRSCVGSTPRRRRGRPRRDAVPERAGAAPVRAAAAPSRPVGSMRSLRSESLSAVTHRLGRGRRPRLLRRRRRRVARAVPRRWRRSRVETAALLVAALGEQQGSLCAALLRDGARGSVQRVVQAPEAGKRLAQQQARARVRGLELHRQLARARGLREVVVVEVERRVAEVAVGLVAAELLATRGFFLKPVPSWRPRWVCAPWAPRGCSRRTPWSPQISGVPTENADATARTRLPREGKGRARRTRLQRVRRSRDARSLGGLAPVTRAVPRPSPLRAPFCSAAASADAIGERVARRATVSRRLSHHRRGCLSTKRMS